MWPPLLQLTRDECRGLVRRLELESYAAVLNVFRAHGALTEAKMKILSDLREILHISIDRHRAEARRVCSDEHLSTIAETLFGSNTWQDWSREGRRAYPLLPRVAPLTALNIIADDIARRTTEENEKLLSVDIALGIQTQLKSAIEAQQVDRKADVVSEEAFKMPDVPSLIKNNMKRNIQEEASQTKKIGYQSEKQSNLQLIDKDDKSFDLEHQELYRRLQQQRFFYAQNQKHKIKLSSKKSSSVNQLKTVKKRRNTSGNRGSRRSQKSQRLPDALIQQYNASLECDINDLGTHSNSIPANFVNNFIEQQPFGQANDDEPKEQVSISRKRNSLKKLVTKGDSQKPLVVPTAQVALNNRDDAKFQDEKHCKEFRVLSKSPSKIQLTHTNQQESTLVTPWSQDVPSATGQASSIAETSHKISAIQATSPIKSTGLILPPESKFAFKKFGGTSVSPRKICSNAIQGSSLSPPQTLNLTKIKPVSLPIRIVTHEQQKFQINAKEICKDDSRSQASSSTLPFALNNLPLSPTSLGIIKNIPASSINNTLITPLVQSSNISTLNAENNLRKTAIVKSSVNSFTPTGVISSALVCGNSVATSSKNIVPKVSAAVTGNTNATSNCSVISNVRLSPVSGKGVIRNANQLNLKQITPTGLRGNVKICQSPNGNVFIQPVITGDGGKIKLQTTHLHKFEPGAPSPASSVPISVDGGRISLKKLQLLPGVITSCTNTNSAVCTPKPTTLTLSGNSKGNMVIVPTTIPAGIRTVNISGKVPGMVYNFVPKSGVNLIGQNASSRLKIPTEADHSAKTVFQRLVAEDTPIHFVKGNDSDNSLIQTRKQPIIELTDHSNTKWETASEKRSKVITLNATDWEMELDQQCSLSTKSSSTGTSNQDQQNDGEQNDSTIDRKADQFIKTLAFSSLSKRDAGNDMDLRPVDMELEDITPMDNNSSLIPFNKEDLTGQKCRQLLKEQSGTN